MSKCYNKNAPEYKALQQSFPNDAAVNGVISQWQAITKSDDFPTVDQAKKTIEDSKVAFALKQKEFAQSLLGNFSRLKIASYSEKLGGYHYVKNTADGKGIEGYNEEALENNRKRLLRYLDINNIPRDTVSLIRTDKSYKVIINDGLFTAKDLLPKNRAAATTHTRDVLSHLARIFPQVKIRVTSPSIAEGYYERIPKANKAKVPFSQVKSFYFNGQVILIKGRVDNDTAIEEVLHAFTDSIAYDNPELFESFLQEARKAFPELKQQIDNAYNTKIRKFTQKDRDLELVTQALTRHFSNQYENEPTKSFFDKVGDILNWLADVIQSLHRYITGDSKLKITTSMINSKSTMSDVAKLLNTSDIEFKLSKPDKSKVRYALSSEKETTLNKATKGANDIQQEMVKNLFNIVSSNKESVNSLSAGKAEIAEGNSIVIQNEKDGKYYQVDDLTKEFKSADEAISGEPMSEAAKKVNADINVLIEAVASSEKFDDVKSNLKSLSEDESRSLFESLGEFVNQYKNQGDIVIPNVVLHASNKMGDNVASTANFVVISKAGKLKTIDVKINEGKSATLKTGSLLKDKFNVTNLSETQQHYIKANLHRRMIQNMGYEVEYADEAVTTFNIDLDTKTGSIKINAPYFHPESQNMIYVDRIMPKKINQQQAEKLKEAQKKSDDYAIMEDPEILNINNELEDANNIGETDYGGVEFDVLFKGLDKFKTAMINRISALQQVKSAISMDKSKEKTIIKLNLAITMVTEALRNQDGLAASKLYTTFLNDSIKEVEALEKYLLDPKNIEDDNFIRRARNAKAFAKTFEGLNISATYGNLNPTQIKLKDKLVETLNRIAGSNLNDEMSVADKAVIDHVKTMFKNTTTKDITDEELEQLFNEAFPDISLAAYNLTDITSSKNSMLAVMKKIWHQKREEALDKVEQRESTLLAAGSYLKKLSPGKSDKEVFEFMIETDEKGNHTGMYVQKIGKQYYDIYNKLQEQTVDVDGSPLQYRTILDIKTAKPEDIAYNKDLYAKKKAFAEFRRAERHQAGRPADGEFHKYTDEFKAIRSQYQEYIDAGKYGYWEFKTNITQAEKDKFYSLYHNEVVYEKPLLIGGVFTGLTKTEKAYFPLRKYTEVQEKAISKDGTVQDMRSPKYKAIMEAAPGDALAQARKSFYMTIVEHYEEGMLKQLPQHVRDYMLGKTPRVQGNLMKNINMNSEGFVKLLSKTKSDVKDFFTETTRLSRVNVNEQGEIVDTLPIMFVGSLKDEEKIKEVQNQIAELKQKYAENKISSVAYGKELKVLKSKDIALRSKPKAEELSWDIVSTMLKFSAMAQTYETMSSIEDTLLSFVQVIENKKYTEPETSRVKKIINNASSKVINKKTGDTEAVTDGKMSNTGKAARAFMSMVFYDNAGITKGMYEKAVDKLLNYTSLSYVGFNVFGNFNNYALGRINNGIEMMGQRYFARDAYIRASKEFNKRGISDLVKRTSYAANKKLTGSKYDPYKATSKYEAFVDLLRMMDNKSDLREATRNSDYKSYFSMATEWGYILQDAAEYNVQSKVGMAIVMDTYILNENTGEVLSLYDAFDMDSDQELKLKDGFTTIVKPKKDIPSFGAITKGNVYQKDAKGNLLYTVQGKYDDKFRYDLRMKIREVNKQIHGNYAYEDRMVLQTHTWGKLLVQFKKWVVPAIKARYQKQYYDENLGYVEGRYVSHAKFMKYVLKNASKLVSSKEGVMESWLKDRGFKNDGTQKDEQFINAALNVHRTNAELMIYLATLMAILIVEGIWEGDDDDSETVKRIKNLSRYQLKRVEDELSIFIPFLGLSDALQFFDSPFAVTKTLGGFSDILDKSWDATTAGIAYGLTGNQEEWYGNSDVYYQRGRRKGTLKLNKEIQDIVPILYEFKKWDDFIQMNDFYIN